MAHRKKSKPNSVKGSRRWLRTSATNRAKDWQKTYREYKNLLKKLATLSSLAEHRIDIAERQEHNL